MDRVVKVKKEQAEYSEPVNAPPPNNHAPAQPKALTVE